MKERICIAIGFWQKLTGQIRLLRKKRRIMLLGHKHIGLEILCHFFITDASFLCNCCKNLPSQAKLNESLPTHVVNCHTIWQLHLLASKREAWIKNHIPLRSYSAVATCWELRDRDHVFRRVQNMVARDPVSRLPVTCYRVQASRSQKSGLLLRIRKWPVQ